MLRDETKARLRRLSQQRLAKSLVKTTATPPQLATSAPWPTSSTRSPAKSDLSSGVEVRASSGCHWLVRRPLSQLWPSACGFVDGWISKRAAKASREESDEYREFLRWFPEHIVFLDLETCGFAGSPVFLAGILHHFDGEMTLSQYWARNLAEERPLMESLRDAVRDRHVLVTFNGKSFDWPQVHDRCVLHTGAVGGGLPNLAHLDLLHMSRRRWKGELPNCKLQTIERFIFGRMRHGDIPGSDIPQVYQQYVRTGQQKDANRILHHNALDLITLLQLALCIHD